MNLRDYLLEIARRYDRHASMADPIQLLLKAATEHIADEVPAGIAIHGSGGQGRPTLTPWIGFFDPDETTSPQEGIYIVFLFSEKLDEVCLALMQGITALTTRLGPGAARGRLAEDAARLREAIAPHIPEGFGDRLRLGSGGFRQRGYAAGTITCKTYSVQDLPPLETLRNDLASVFETYQKAIAAKRRLLQAEPGAILSPSVLQKSDENTDPLQDFRPKNDADYVAHLVGQAVVKSRRHESVVRDYGLWVAERGFRLSTREHPRDLVLYRNGTTWLLEAKVLYQGNATEAVRAALGQLFTYRHFLYRDALPPRLVALFSEPIGSAYVEFLEGCEVASVWRERGTWRGSRSASTDGVGDPA